MSVLIKRVNIPRKIILIDLRAGIHWRQWIGSRGGSSRQIQAIPIPPFVARATLIHPWRNHMNIRLDMRCTCTMMMILMVRWLTILQIQDRSSINKLCIIVFVTRAARTRRCRRQVTLFIRPLYLDSMLCFRWAPKLTGTSKSTLRYLPVCSSASPYSTHRLICRQSYLSAQTTNELR